MGSRSVAGMNGMMMSDAVASGGVFPSGGPYSLRPSSCASKPADAAAALLGPRERHLVRSFCAQHVSCTRVQLTRRSNGQTRIAPGDEGPRPALIAYGSERATRLLNSARAETQFITRTDGWPTGAA